MSSDSFFNWVFVTNGRQTVLTYIPISAIQVGVSNDFAFYLIAIANGASAFGRISSGLLADRVGACLLQANHARSPWCSYACAGALNVMIPFTTLAAAMTFAWPFATSKGALIAVAVIYGYVDLYHRRPSTVDCRWLSALNVPVPCDSFACGTYVSLLAVPAMAMGAIGDVGRRTGLFLSFAAFGALGGPPISGAINSATGGFEGVGWWAGKRSESFRTHCVLSLE